MNDVAASAERRTRADGDRTKRLILDAKGSMG
jgi:hypothetical protein